LNEKASNCVNAISHLGSGFCKPVWADWYAYFIIGFLYAYI